MKNKVISLQFFNRDVTTVARELLGCYLVIKQKNKQVRLIITETEAYDGIHDKACHAHKGKTKRTQVMFGPPGHWYVYLIYGMYDMLNIVTREEEYPSAVLLRGAGEYDGPGKLTKNLGITRECNTKPATPETGLWIEDGVQVQDEDVEMTPRIGVEYAGPIWSEKLYRYIVTNKKKYQ